MAPLKTHLARAIGNRRANLARQAQRARALHARLQAETATAVQARQAATMTGSPGTSNPSGGKPP